MPNSPQVNDLVFAKVKKILPYGAFCTLEEYGNQEAFLHISEVAPRWIKNIHEFLREGQHLVCKVHRIVPEKNQIDISLKRVTEAESKRKVQVSRLEKRSAKLFDVAIKQAKSTAVEADEAKKALEQKYGDLMEAFEVVSEEGEAALEGLKIEKGLAKAILLISQKSIKKTKAMLKEVLKLASYSPQGVEDVKKAIGSIKGSDDAELGIHYLGAPRYQITITAKDYKQAQKAMDKIHSTIEKKAKEGDMLLEWEAAS